MYSSLVIAMLSHAMYCICELRTWKVFFVVGLSLSGSDPVSDLVDVNQGIQWCKKIAPLVKQI